MKRWCGGAVIPLLTVGPGQNSGDKKNLFCLKGSRLAYYFFIFHVKFSAVCLSWYQ